MGTARARLAESGVCPACRDFVAKPSSRAGTVLSAIFVQDTLSGRLPTVPTAPAGPRCSCRSAGTPSWAPANPDAAGTRSCRRSRTAGRGSRSPYPAACRIRFQVFKVEQRWLLIGAKINTSDICPLDAALTRRISIRRHLPGRGTAISLKILLYNPDNGVTQNFMPHLWMFLLQSLTPAGNEVLLIDGNTKPMTDPELVQYALDQKIGLLGIGAMTRMIAKAYRVADALRAAGVPVVMGGPHVTECPDEALGRDCGPRHADAIALGEADETWPRFVAAPVSGHLKEVYTRVDVF